MKEVYTLDDLVSREVLNAGAEKPARLAVIGRPIGHSASPRMHQAALDALGIDARYIRIEVEPGRVGEALGRMRDLGFIGCNVTVPHKLEVMEHCFVSDSARFLGAVNTIHFVKDSESPDQYVTCGYNTDGEGFSRAVTELLATSPTKVSTALGDYKIAIVGAGGGAGQAIASYCFQEDVRKLVLINRTVSKLDGLVVRLGQETSGCELVPLSFDSPDLREQCLDCDIIVNASSVGLHDGEYPSVLDEECLKPEHFVYDMIYKKTVTPFLSMAKAKGCNIADGSSMLLHQGALAFQIWFPGTEPLKWMRRGLGIGGG